MQGRLIVFEGTDGSGKATQSALLCRELERRGIPFRKLEFPRYQEESSALIRLYLGGAFGSAPDDVNAYAASTFYSVDRYASYKQDWGGFYESGGLLIADRYTTSNAVHQTAKLPPEEILGRLAFLAGFNPAAAPKTAAALLPEFDWDKVSCEDIRIPEGLFY